MLQLTFHHVWHAVALEAAYIVQLSLGVEMTREAFCAMQRGRRGFTWFRGLR